MKPLLISWSLLGWLSLFSFSSYAQKPFTVYSLCVGSADYLEDFTRFEDGFAGFSSVPSAAVSARMMHRQLRTIHASYSDTLISTPAKLITRQAVIAACTKLIQRAKTERKPNPLLVFYFAGHGVSEGLGWNLFLMPGDFCYKINSDLPKLSDQALYAGDLYDALEAAKLPFVLLLDCCYEGKQQDISTKEFEYQQSLLQMAELAKSSMAIVRKMNEFEEVNPVVFSTTPGRLTETVPLPGNSRLKVGPLCRRSMLAWQKLGPTTTSVSLAEYISWLTKEDVDKNNNSHPLTNWDKESCGFRADKLPFKK
ncbi:caspase family protein [Hymenobacter sp. HD11105]